MLKFCEKTICINKEMQIIIWNHKKGLYSNSKHLDHSF